MNRSQRLHRIALMAIVLIVVMVTAFGSWSCSEGGNSGKVETVTIGATCIELNALIYVADEHRFFKTNRVEVVFKDYETGVAATNGLLKGEVDIALTTAFVIVEKLFQKQDVLDLATIDKSMLFYIIARTDRRIRTTADLKGKRIGVPRQTISEFYLGRMLELNGMRIQQVTMVDTRPSDPAGTIAGGEVDAIVTWEPYVTQIRLQMGNGVITWPAQSGQVSFWSVASTPGWINKHPDLVRQFLKSLAQAEEYIIQHPVEAKKILQKRLKLDDTYIATVWSQNQFSLSLDQSLIEIPIEDSAAPILDAAGNVIGVVLVFHDVTAKRHAQEELRQAHGRASWLARFPDENPNPVLLASPDGIVLYCNPATSKLSGWTCEVGQPIQNKLSPLVGQAMAEGREVQEDVQLDGKVYIVWAIPFPQEGYVNVYGRDITERKMAEAQLSQNQKTFSELVERAPFGIYIVDSQFRIAQMNAGSQSGAFRNVRPVLGRDFAEAMRILWPEPVAAEIIGVFRHTLETGEPYYSPPFIHPRHDVETLESYEWELHRMTLPDGQYGVICYYFDSTKLREAEAALRESAERLNRAEEIAHLGSWELDLVSNRLMWSDEVYRIFGLQPQEFGATYEAFLEAVHPDDRDAVDAAYSGSLREGRDSYEIEHRVVRKSTSEIRFVHERCEHIRDASGQIIRSIGMVHNITERKRMEEELRQAEEKSRLLIKYAPSMFYEIDFHGPAFVSVNDAMCQFLGYTREELLAMSPFDFLDDEGKALFRERIRRQLAGEAIGESVEYKSKTKDGREVHCVLNVTFTYKDGKLEGQSSWLTTSPSVNGSKRR